MVGASSSLALRKVAGEAIDSSGGCRARPYPVVRHRLQLRRGIGDRRALPGRGQGRDAGNCKVAGKGANGGLKAHTCTYSTRHLGPLHRAVMFGWHRHTGLWLIGASIPSFVPHTGEAYFISVNHSVLGFCTNERHSVLNGFRIIIGTGLQG